MQMGIKDDYIYINCLELRRNTYGPHLQFANEVKLYIHYMYKKSVSIIN